MLILRKIRSFFEEYWCECAATVSFSILCHLAVRFIIDRPSTSLGRFLFFSVIIADIVLTLLFLRILWLKKWKSALAKASQKAFETLSRWVLKLIDRIFERFGLRSNQTIIKGKTEVIFDSVDGGRLDRRKKAKRWKHMESDRERLRFLYGSMITHRIKEGKRARSSDTPLELCEREENTHTEEELFTLYIDARYDDRTEVKEETVMSLKRRLEVTLNIK